MFFTKVFHSPPSAEVIQLGQTIPSLFHETCDRYPNSQALQDWMSAQAKWRSLSNQAFQQASEELALGLLNLSLSKGNLVSFFMHSDINFCLADMACLLAGLVDVPIDPGLDRSSIQFIFQQTAATVLVVSNLELLYRILPNLPEIIALKTIIVAEMPGDGLLPKLLGVEVVSLESVREAGLAQWSVARLQAMREAIAPSDIATIVYTTGTNGQPKGVILSHGSLAGSMLASFGSIAQLKKGRAEVALLFLPLTHIFARIFLYGHLCYSHRVYFTTANRIAQHLRTVRPTLLIIVPRFLEKVQERMVERGTSLQGMSRWGFHWAMTLAKRYDVGQPPRGWYALQLQLARLVFAQWRAEFGGRVKYVISGGAALKAELVNLFSAAGIPIFQGYGLTESCSALCCNRVGQNRAGTVGVPIAGVEMAIAPNGEILAKTPYKMQGYYQDEVATRKAIDAEGWLHTGDLGKFTAEGFLQITGHRKPLFKLSTGKYVAPLPIEQQLKRSPFVKQAIVVGAQRKFCALLIFPDLDYLCLQAEGMCGALPLDQLLRHPKITALYQTLVDEVNQLLPHWSTVKRFRLLHLILALENGLPEPALMIKRDNVNHFFTAEIEAMYHVSIQSRKLKKIRRSCPPVQPSPNLFPGLEEAQPAWATVPVLPRVLNALNSQWTTLRVRGDSHHG
jgi:long-chain acyl-CoA synthetase